MKRYLAALLMALCAFGAQAAEADVPAEKPAWETTLAKVKDMWPDTGLCSFLKKEAPAFITGNFDEAARPERKPLSANRSKTL